MSLLGKPLIKGIPSILKKKHYYNIAVSVMR
jgi:hypothetical protein